MYRAQAEKLKNKLKEEIENLGINISGSSEKQYHFELVVTDGINRNNVNIFFGKKGVKTILQGQTGTSLYNILSGLTGNSLIQNKTDISPTNYIGSDESGKGDFFGPLVVCAVYLNKDINEKLNKSGVKDSKLLSPQQIYKMAPVLIRKLKGNFAVRILEPASYNKLYSQIKNLNILLENLHREVIEELLPKTRPEQIIIDQFSKKQFFLSEKFKNTNVEIIQRTRAEEFTAVAAASIIARYYFEEWFYMIKDKGFNLPKGASKAVDEEAVIIYKEKGENIFKDISKLHFKTYKKIFSDL